MTMLLGVAIGVVLTWAGAYAWGFFGELLKNRRWRAEAMKVGPCNLRLSRIEDGYEPAGPAPKRHEITITMLGQEDF